MVSFSGRIWLLICFAVILSWWVWEVLVWMWWRPKKLERFLRGQGFKGSPRKSLFGDFEEFKSVTKKALSKPIMPLSHIIVPRVIPFLHQIVERYGSLSYTWFGATPRVYIVEPEIIRDILSNKSGHFLKIKTNPLVKLLANGLAGQEGQKWAIHRRTVKPAFHLEKLKTMVPAIVASCSNLVKKWEKLALDNGLCELDVWPEFQYLTGDVISRTAFGSSYEQAQRIFQLQTEQAEHVIQAFHSMYIPGFSWFFPRKRNKRMKEIYREANIILRDMINKRVNAINHGEAHSDDLLGFLLESNLKQNQEQGNSKNIAMTMDDIIKECKQFYIAGQETTSSLLVWTMVVLSMHQEWQTRAREEVLYVFGRKRPNFDGLNHLKIVTMILHEVLRLYPPVTQMLRRTEKEIKLQSITLPKGVEIFIPTILVHHDHELWGQDVEEFNPERFSQGVLKATKNRFSFFPFGAGPRICIGQNFAMIEAKIAISMILQHFSFKLSPTYVHAPYTVLTLQPQCGAQIILQKL